MRLEALKHFNQIKQGNLLLINDGSDEIIHTKVLLVKVSQYDGEEVIFDLKRNLYFNVGMYLEGESWAKEVAIVRV